MIKGILMLVRLLWLVAILTGALFYFRPALLPINLHMYLGFAIALLMLVLGAIGVRRIAGLSVATILVAILLPVVGILQLVHIGRADLPYLQAAHVLLGVAAIGIAEVLGKRLKTA